MLRIKGLSPNRKNERFLIIEKESDGTICISIEKPGSVYILQKDFNKLKDFNKKK